MSRLGKKPISIPDKVKVTIEEDKGLFIAEGPLGKNQVKYLKENVSVTKEDNKIIVKPKGNEKKHKSQWGLYWKLISNAIKGVLEPFEKQLELNGVGYTASVSGQILTLTLGFIHPIVFVIPPEVNCEVKQEKGKNIIIKLTSIKKELVGEVAARIRALRPVNPYSGKGIKYVDEEVIMKEGKKAKK